MKRHYKCELCEESFDLWEDLDQHQIASHRVEE